MIKNILIVEDDELISRVYKRIFKFKGYDVDVAENGKEALTKIKQKAPELLVLDVMMPKMSGLELLKIVKKDSKLKSIDIVLLTNMGVEEELAKALKMGILGYVIKADHDPDEVVGKVEFMLKEKVDKQDLKKQ